MHQAMLTSYGALTLRAALGTMWIAHALLKYFVFTMAGWSEFLAAKGFSTLFAWPVFLMELVGGAMILAGIYGRFVSLALLPIMLAALAPHVPNGWVHINPGGGWEYPAFLAIASLVHAMLGDGAFALVRRGAPPAPLFAAHSH